MISVVAAQNSAAPTIITSPISWRGSIAGVGNAERDQHAGERQAKAQPLRSAKAIRRQNNARAKHHKERREIDEQHRTRRGRVEQALIDQDELDREQKARAASPNHSVPSRLSNAMPRSRHHAAIRQRGDDRTDCRLR